MSQHRLRTTVNGQPMFVMSGWDNQLQTFFLTIEDEKGEVIYSDIDDMPFTVLGLQPIQCFDFFVEKAEKYGVILPEPMIEAIKEDQVIEPMNRFVVWESSGEKKSDSCAI
ncbi:hypothetical protein [Suttonella ornithocola]|uniref:Uncharacterized protein n=2 Tax=Suttonella ornithocola TaxID=279832 RepID=A0A380MYJ2_9GAMM|nr:hypothetical protein [Suttonella ornithocola]SUO96751.1 Uncharacterised protein [Suttonella ornithocola]